MPSPARGRHGRLTPSAEAAAAVPPRSEGGPVVTAVGPPRVRDSGDWSSHVGVPGSLSRPGAGQGLLRGTGGDGARIKPVDEVCQPLPVARCWHGRLGRGGSRFRPADHVTFRPVARWLGHGSGGLRNHEWSLLEPHLPPQAVAAGGTITGRVPKKGTTPRHHRPDDGLGRSRGCLTSKIHLAGEGGCRPMALLVTPGQWGDAPQMIEVLDRIRIPRPLGGRPRARAL